MPSPFTSRPLAPSRLNRAVQKRPFLFFGLPFILLMVGASYGMTPFAQTRYDLGDGKVKQLNKEQELRLAADRKKFDIREEYFKLESRVEEDWEPKRIARPKGVPEWGGAGEKEERFPEGKK